MKIMQTVAVVTGGASGLGRACVEALANRGARVVVWDKQPAEAVSQAALSCECDVVDEHSVKEALNKTLDTVGIPRILIQCAGIIASARMVGRSGPMPLDYFKKVIEVNLVGTFNVMRLISASMMTLPLNEEEERGVVINTASIAAYEGQIGQTAYSASKGGIVAMTLPAARELAQHAIRVNAIAPGLMETPMLLGLPDEVQDNLKKTCVFPMRLGRADEFGALACHLVENALMNGEVVRLDGAIRLEPR